MFGETITIIRAGEETGEYDEQGTPILGPPVEFTSHGWAVAPVTGGESSEPFGQQLIAGFTLYNPDSCDDIHPTDRVRVRGHEHAVAGDVADWSSPVASGTCGVVVHVKRMS